MSELESLSKTFKGDIVTPSSADYEKAIARWAINAQRKAKVVAFVKDSEDVVLAIKYAKANKLPVAIRGGGHSASGASSSEDGLVIDLSRHLNGVKVDADKKLAYVGGGAIWETVDKAAIEHGLATVGGTVNHTGVGGLLLGGGFGWLSGAYGLVIDNVQQVTLVTADGSILTLNETTNPDLFWGIRGGGSNFGVCTEFVLRLHPQRRTVFAGPIVFPPTALESLVTATEKWWDNGPSQKDVLQVGHTRGPDGQPCILAIMFYNGSEAEGRANFKFLYDIGPVADMAKEIPYEALNTLHNPFAKHGSARYIKGVIQTKSQVSTIQTVFDLAMEISATGDPKLTIIYEYMPVAKTNSPPAALLRRPGYNVVILASWEKDTPENLKTVQGCVRNMADILSKSQTTLTEADKMGYGNYDTEFEGTVVTTNEVILDDRARALFGENYPKLQALKKKYDPENTFSKWFVITPAL
jgi:hypothetical protein